MCSHVQRSADSCAVAARVSFQVKGEAPCNARKLLCLSKAVALKSSPSEVLGVGEDSGVEGSTEEVVGEGSSAGTSGEEGVGVLLGVESEGSSEDVGIDPVAGGGDSLGELGDVSVGTDAGYGVEVLC